MNITEKNITKIIGNAKMIVNFDTQKMSLIATDHTHLTEGILINRPYNDAVAITTRICGNCSISHHVASLLALENAFKIDVSSITKKLRELMMCAHFIESHTQHLYFLTPDNYQNSNNNSLFLAPNSDAIKLKELAETILQTIAGNTIHPNTTAIGGFKYLPTTKELKKLLQLSQNNLKTAKKLAKIYTNTKYPNLQKATTYLSLTSTRGYTIFSDTIESSSGETFNSRNYTKKITEQISSSPIKTAYYKNKEFMVGALARLSLHANRLAPEAKKIHINSIKKFSSFPAYNSFHNQYAQSIEIIHFIEITINILIQLLSLSSYKNITIKPYKAKASSGRSIIESPKGLLYHYYEINKQGLIKNCNIISPTAQSLNNLEADANLLLEQTLGLNNKTRLELIEMLIQAYDPCPTCLLH